MKNKIDLNRPVKTRDGREAEVFCERDGFLYGRYKAKDGNYWHSTDWTLNGSFWTNRNYPSSEQKEDLIQEPVIKTVTFWVNVYAETGVDDCGCYSSREIADLNRNRCATRIACLKCTHVFQEGEGL